MGRLKHLKSQFLSYPNFATAAAALSQERAKPSSVDYHICIERSGYGGYCLKRTLLELYVDAAVENPASVHRPAIFQP